ncbi:MAG: 1-acyl-sn-glycerol-3-phosphate acyltransferase [Anderseniella sp.]
MSGTITLPTWFAVLAVVLATLAVVNHFLLPALRWMARRSVNKAILDVNRRFDLKLPLFQLTKRQVLIDRLVYDPEVLDTVAHIANERGVTRDGVMAEVVAFAREIVPSFNPYIYFNLGYRIARRFLRYFYHVRVGWVHDAAQKDVPAAASVVFFINHRSNLDYLLVTYLASQRAALSYGAGEWARVWPFRAILRLAGAYILRRNLDDPVYRVVLRRYVQMATAAGVPHAIFSEGALSRNGMVNAPKLGLLSYVCRNFDPSGDSDIYFVPVGTNFDRVVEQRTLIANVDTDYRGRGAGFVLGSTLVFVCRQIWLKLTRRWQGFGVAAANFGEPLSLRDWSKRHDVSLVSLEQEPLFDAVEALGKELHGRIIETIPVLAVPLLAMVLLTTDEPMSRNQLQQEALKKLADLRAKGAHPGIKDGGEETAITDGIDLMTRLNLITINGQGKVEPNAADRNLLQYHANSMIQLNASLEAE